jgi:aspartyl/asparaginyl beta-hydroxylase (cupin superfamily)
MPAGEWWYLDQRKPHTARNGGSTDRIHLVCDVVATQELHDLLSSAR